VGSERPQRQTRREQGQHEQHEGQHAGDGAPLPDGQAVRERDERGRTRDGNEQRQQHVAALGRLDEGGPVQRTEHPERRERAQPCPLGVRARRCGGGERLADGGAGGAHQATSATRRVPLSS
jgi:hypothetical protein